MLDLAAVRAGGRQPAPEIATRELRSEWSISKPGQALPPPTGTAAWPSSGPCSAAPSPATLSSLAVASSRSGIGAYLLPGQALPLPPGTVVGLLAGGLSVCPDAAEAALLG